MLNRLTFASTLSHLRRLNSPIDRTGKIAKPRQLHNTHWGYICPAETPEGHAVGKSKNADWRKDNLFCLTRCRVFFFIGLVKNLALMASITVGSSSAPVLDLLEGIGLEQLDDLGARSALKNATKIFVDGAWVGIHNHSPSELLFANRLNEQLQATVRVFSYPTLLHEGWHRLQTYQRYDLRFHGGGFQIDKRRVEKKNFKHSSTIYRV